MSIPKTIIQTSRNRQPDYVLAMIQQRYANWQYHFFSDDDIIAYFRANPEAEFADIETRFERIENGAHKADLFRYYYLYQQGGVYLDSDAMTEVPIDSIIGDAHFVSINSYHHNDNLIFNGFLCTTPRHPIMLEALKKLYDIDINLLKEDYFAVCRDLATIVDNYRGNDNKRYKETKPKFYQLAATTYNQEGQALLRHYRYCKMIPDRSRTKGAWRRNLAIYSCYSRKIIARVINKLLSIKS